MKRVYVEYCPTSGCSVKFHELCDALRDRNVVVVGNAKPPRRDAFEVTDEAGHLLYSKLARAEFPDVTDLCQRIMTGRRDSVVARAADPMEQEGGESVETGSRTAGAEHSA
eukprot:tig00021680_g23022.t1